MMKRLMVLLALATATLVTGSAHGESLCVDAGAVYPISTKTPAVSMYGVGLAAGSGVTVTTGPICQPMP